MKNPGLVIDVGMHHGEDTRRYLDMGFHVVGIEANPALADEITRTFSAELRDGRLRFYPVAIGAVAGKASFYIPRPREDIDFPFDAISSLDLSHVKRWSASLGVTDYREVTVPVLPFIAILEDVGVPHYLKVDIEGSDHLCVAALHRCDERPDFVSIESAVRSSLLAAANELAELDELGYRRFTYVDQKSACGSGPFGAQLAQHWLPTPLALLHACALRSRLLLSRLPRPAPPPGTWRPIPGPWDLHARLG